VDASWEATQYEKVYSWLREQIGDAILVPGERLAGERKLAETLGVSRETVRQGLRLAEDAGLIVRVPARGTFVAEPRIRQDLGQMQSFDLTVRGINLTPMYTSVVVGSERAGAAVSSALGVSPGDTIMTVDAVGSGDGKPLAYYRSSIPEHVAARLPADADWRSAATYQVIAAALGLDTLSVRQRWEALPLPDDVAGTLGAAGSTPAFRSTSVFATSDFAPVEMRIGWYPGSRYEFTITRTIEF